MERLFDMVLEKSYQLRKNDKNFNGQEFWQPIKNALTYLDCKKADKWVETPNDIYNIIMKLPEHFENGKINENNHFLIQQVRIPRTEDPTIKKIIQIALNIGQYRGVNNYTKPFNERKDITQFVDDNNIIQLSKYIDDAKILEVETYLSLY